MTGDFRGGDVNAVLDLVVKLVPGDSCAQFSLLACAFALASKSFRVDEDGARAELEGAFELLAGLDLTVASPGCN